MQEQDKSSDIEQQPPFGDRKIIENNLLRHDQRYIYVFSTEL